MKLKALYIITIAAFLFNQSCTKPEIDYTYEIKNLHWTDEGLDHDLDGYATSRTLECQINLLENVERDITIKVYYKLSETSEYIFYHSYEKPGFIGGSDVTVLIPIGLVQELTEGTYSFLIEVYEKDNKRLEASAEIENAQFERLITDQNFDLKVWWNEFDDYDHDGFPRTAFMNIDINVTMNISKVIQAEVFWQKAGTEDDYTSYFKSDYYSITGESPDTLRVPTGFYPDTLGHGMYNFKIIVYEKNVFSPVLIYESELSIALELRPFETDLEDGFTYSLNHENMLWQYIIDLDTDGYAQSKVLAIDVDIDKQETVRIFAKIFRKGPDDEDYEVLDSTDVFTVTGSTANDVVLLPVNSTLVTDSVMMPHGIYDLMIALFEIIPDAEPDLRFATDSINGLLLLQQKFELISEDK